MTRRKTTATTPNVPRSRSRWTRRQRRNFHSLLHVMLGGRLSRFRRLETLITQSSSTAQTSLP